MKQPAPEKQEEPKAEEEYVPVQPILEDPVEDIAAGDKEIVAGDKEIEAGDKSVGNERSQVQDSFCGQFDPAELAFQRAQMMQIEQEHKENAFKEKLQTQAGLRLVKVENDGNCLYRAVAYQVYGDPGKHKIVR